MREESTMRRAIKGLMVFAIVAGSVATGAMRQAAAQEVSYEAEASGNTVRGTAVRSSDYCGSGATGCSGGQKVRRIGSGHADYLAINGVAAATTGNHRVKIYYTSGENRNLSVSVNGGQATELSNLNSGGWSVVASVEVDLHLSAGLNSIKFFKDGEWAPDIDRITVTAVQDPGIDLAVSYEAEASGNTVRGTAVRSSDYCGSGATGCSGGQKVRRIGSGHADYLAINGVAAATTGNHRVKIYYTSGENRNLSVSVNGGQATELSNLNSGGWSVVASVEVDLHLSAGLNSIKFFKDGEWAPDIDRITTAAAVGLNESSSYTYTAALRSQPTTNVTVTIASSNSAVTTNTNVLMFTSSNWNQPQTVTVQAGFDSDGSDTVAALSHTFGGDAIYQALAAVTLPVYVKDLAPRAPLELWGEAGDAQVTLRWAAPSHTNGYSINGYSIQYRAKGTSAWTSSTVGGTLSSTNVTGLTNATNYEMRVAAVTAAGTGAFAVVPLVTPYGYGTWRGLENGAAQLPPMGWASWNAFKKNISEAKIKGIADAMVSKGLKDVGYKYVNIDDGWFLKRRLSDGALQIIPSKFPGAVCTDDAGSCGAGNTSFKPLVDYIHSKGLKAGIYSDRGRNTCLQQSFGDGVQGSVHEQEVGLWGYVQQDIDLFFKTWGFDYLKLDGCGLAWYGENTACHPWGKPNCQQHRPLYPLYPGGGDFYLLLHHDLTHAHDVVVYTGPHSRTIMSPPQIARLARSYADVRDALIAANPDGDFVYSMATWGHGDVLHWGGETGNLWRTTGDIDKAWGPGGTFRASMWEVFLRNAPLALYAGPNRWNDPDMMWVGVGPFDGQTTGNWRRARSHFGLWAIMNAPLLMGNDLTKVPDNILDLLKNTRVIAMNQDPGGHQAIQMAGHGAADDEAKILVKTLSEGPGVKAVALFNPHNSAQDITVTRDHLRFKAGTTATVQNLWTGGTQPAMAASASGYTVRVEGHDTMLLLFRGTHALTNASTSLSCPAIIHVVSNVTPSTPWQTETTTTSRSPSTGPPTRYGIGVHADSHNPSQTRPRLHSVHRQRGCG